VRAGGRKAVGPAAEDRRVVLTVMAYGRQAGVGPARCAGAAPTGNVARGARSGVPAHNRFDVPHFDRFKLKNFELNFKIAKYKSCRPVNPLQLSSRPIGWILNGFGDNHLQSYRFVCIGQTVQQDFDWVFEDSNLRIWNANNGMKCVPGKIRNLAVGRFWSSMGKFWERVGKLIQP
jgi:hypothetical protein